ncbi:stage V sporulation protein AB [Murimonas intestini]|uniref:Stage V sporulation protein AB n=1 Tax=Murimonas intestini TaxID=1337051 RepID=A0AB73SYS4_9FIRM|nr:stage V sporulation protein AB [Murimonas intestini]MCR1868062.1 stage V sporulation protein AB [Murimonas intestini]MCR1885530.1 stage V sporulation protein AB [Murimonas intestini]
MLVQVLMGIIGLSSGFVVAGGVIALVIGLGIVTRYVGITHTGEYLWLYEDIILLGGIFGVLLTVYNIHVPFGAAGLALLGIGAGIYVGGWILALAEIVNIFPIMARRIGLVKGMSLVIIFMAAGKILGSLLHFYMRW